MNSKITNALLFEGKWQESHVFDPVLELKKLNFQFDIDFGLPKLPMKPGLISIRGPRQYGKSTWLIQQMIKTLEEFGAGSCFYVNGDDVLNPETLYQELSMLIGMFPKKSGIKRIFIDEITSVKNWENALKRLYDQGLSRNILLVTTGSKATDLRRGAEKLPGRKGKLDRTEYIFTPLSYAEFKKKCGTTFKEDSLIAYMLSGGSPIAANELAQNHTIPLYLQSLVRDWILGECAASKRSRNQMVWLLHEIHRHGGSHMSLAKLARDINVANNTVLQGYLDLLQDLMCIGDSIPVDSSRENGIPRKEHKYPFTNLLVANVFHFNGVISMNDWKKLRPEEQGKWMEWMVAQEISRRKAIQGDSDPQITFHFQSQKYELDFRSEKKQWIEVKRGKANALEFSWFLKVFPNQHLKVISSQTFGSQKINGITLEDFLLED